MDINLRPFVLADSDGIADTLADGWARAYGHFLPAEILAPRADRKLRRPELLEFLRDEFDPASEALYVAEEAGAVVGFIHVCLGDKADLGAGGYVSLLYVNADRGGKGLGRQLLAEGAAWLAARTGGPIAIAAFKDNPYHPFYAHLGGIIAKVQDVSIADFACQSVVYLWPDADALRQAARSPTGPQARGL